MTPQPKRAAAIEAAAIPLTWPHPSSAGPDHYAVLRSEIDALRAAVALPPDPPQLAGAEVAEVLRELRDHISKMIGRDNSGTQHVLYGVRYFDIRDVLAAIDRAAAKCAQPAPAVDRGELRKRIKTELQRWYVLRASPNPSPSLLDEHVDRILALPGIGAVSPQEPAHRHECCGHEGLDISDGAAPTAALDAEDAATRKATEGGSGGAEAWRKRIGAAIPNGMHWGEHRIADLLDEAAAVWRERDELRAWQRKACSHIDEIRKTMDAVNARRDRKEAL